MIGNQKVDNIMLLVNTYKNEPSVRNYNSVYEAIDNALLRPVKAPADEVFVDLVGELEKEKKRYENSRGKDNDYCIGAAYALGVAAHRLKEILARHKASDKGVK